MTGITIKGTGRYLPERIVENEEFTSFLDTSDEWIRSHTGIERRRVAIDEPTWYMGAEAAKKALAAAGVEASAIDCIICSTVTPDFYFPSAACMVQGAIGASSAFCYDISVACAGFTYGLDMARRYLNTGDVDTVLLVSAETLTRVTNFADRASCVLFGDGAGAVVITRGDNAFGSFLQSDGTGAKHLYARHTRQTTPFEEGILKRELNPFPAPDDNFTYMEGHDVYRFATRAMPRAVKKACEKAGFAVSDLDLVIPHQANIRIIQAAVKHMGLPMEKVYINIQNYGNNSSATIPIGLDECVRSGRIKPGDRVCSVGFGSGLVSAAVVLEYQNA